LIVAYPGGGLTPGYPEIALLLLGAATWGAGFPLVQALINQRVPSNRRATMLSTANLASKPVFIPLSSAIRWLTSLHGPANGVLGLATWLAVTGAIAVVLARMLPRLGADAA
jgi:hypothetical protein